MTPALILSIGMMNFIQIALLILPKIRKWKLSVRKWKLRAPGARKGDELIGRQLLL